MTVKIDEMTIGEAKEIAKLFGFIGGNVEANAATQHGAIGKKCIVRTYASGVHYGEVVSAENNDGRSRCELKNSRRLWYWKAAKSISLSGVATHGIDEQSSKVCERVDSIFIEDAIEFIPASGDAILSIEGAKTYEP